MKGLGLRGARDRRYAQFIGGAAQSIIPLLPVRIRTTIQSKGE